MRLLVVYSQKLYLATEGLICADVYGFVAALVAGRKKQRALDNPQKI